MYAILETAYGLDLCEDSTFYKQNKEVCELLMELDIADSRYSGSGPYPYFIAATFESFAAFEIKDPSALENSYPSQQEMDREFNKIKNEAVANIEKILLTYKENPEKIGEEYECSQEEITLLESFVIYLKSLAKPKKFIINQTS